MASVLTPDFNIAYSGTHFLQQMFYQPEEKNWGFGIYNVHGNVKYEKTLYFPQSLRKIWRTYTTCGFSATGGVTTITDKQLVVNKIKSNLEQCAHEFDDTVFVETLKEGNNIDDLSGTILENIIFTQIRKATASDMHRIVWFADSASANADYNQFDGWFKLFENNAAAIQATGNFYDTTASITGAETAGVLNADGAYTILDTMFDSMNPVLANTPNMTMDSGVTGGKAFYVTRKIYNNLLKTYEQSVGSNDLGLNRLMGGPGSMDTLAFRGIPVIVVPEWDVNLADTDNPVNGVFGVNTVVLTISDNLVIGTDVNDSNTDTTEFRVRNLDDDSETMKIIQKMKLGTQYLHEEFISVAK